jgi:hypothetical protein
VTGRRLVQQPALEVRRTECKHPFKRAGDRRALCWAKKADPSFDMIHDFFPVAAMEANSFLEQPREQVQSILFQLHDELVSG